MTSLRGSVKVFVVACFVSTVSVCSSSAQVRQAQPSLGTAGAGYCDIRVALGTPGVVTYAPEAPANLRIMGTRYRDLQSTLVAYGKSRVSLVSYDGRVFGPAGSVDDVGSYYFIPALVIHFGLSLPRAIQVFYSALLLAALGLGILGCCLVLHTGVGVAWTIVSLVLVTGLAYRIGDVYIFLAATVLSIAPLALHVIENHRVVTARLFVFATGLAVSTANTIRSHSGTAVLLFVVCLVLTQIDGRRRKLILIVLLLCGFALPQLYFSHLVRQRDQFLRSICPAYPEFSARHPFWHAAYTGLGFLRNDFVAGYDDQVSYDAVQSIVPGTLYASAQYERVLRSQVLLLLLRHPALVIYTIAAKLGIVCLLFVLSANVGLIAAFLSPKPLGVELAFWLAMVSDASFGILVMPRITYLLGLITLAVLYGVVSVDVALRPQSRRSGVRFQTRVRGEMPPLDPDATIEPALSPIAGHVRSPNILSSVLRSYVL